MILDLNKLHATRRLHCDICIVGSGAAGMTMAQALVDSRLDVVVLEAGHHRLDARQQDLLTGASIGQPFPVEGGRYRMVGGSTSAWTGRCAPLDPIDLTMRDWVPGSGWPIDYAELARWYPAAEETSGFPAGFTPPAGLASTLPQDSADLLTPFQWRFAPVGWKRFQNWATRYAGLLARSSRSHLLVNANLTAIRFNEARDRVEELDARSLDGAHITIQPAITVLCGGGIENARLLLHAARDGPVGQVQDSIGRYFMQHTRADTATIACDDQQSAALQQAFNNFTRRRGIQIERGLAFTSTAQQRLRLVNASIHLRYARPDSLRAQVAALRSGGKVQPLSMLKAAGRAASRPDLVARRLSRRLVGQHALVTRPVVKVVIDLEQVPDRDSRITLSDMRDAFGLHRAAVDWRVSEAERRSSAVLHHGLANFLSANNLGLLVPAPDMAVTGGLTPDRLLPSFHHIGATRMSNGPSDGVVDANCRVHGMNNLYVCGASVMPTGGHANPTLTIVALALRLAHYLMESAAVVI